MNLLSKLPKPLLGDIINNRCIPILGAGFSKNAILKNGGKMPLWGDVGKHFSQQLGEDIGLPPLETISAFCHEYNKTTAIDQLRELLHIYDSEPGPTHLSFVRLPFDIVITTNFDLLLEKAYDKEKIYYHSVTEDEQLSTSLVNEIASTMKNIPPYKPRILLKIHRDINNIRNVVLTEDDYDLFVNHHPLMSTVV